MVVSPLLVLSAEVAIGLSVWIIAKGAFKKRLIPVTVTVKWQSTIAKDRKIVVAAKAVLGRKTDLSRNWFFLSVRVFRKVLTYTLVCYDYTYAKRPFQIKYR